MNITHLAAATPISLLFRFWGCNTGVVKIGTVRNAKRIITKKHFLRTERAANTSILFSQCGAHASTCYVSAHTRYAHLHKQHNRKERISAFDSFTTVTWREQCGHWYSRVDSISTLARATLAREEDKERERCCSRFWRRCTWTLNCWSS